MQLNLMENNIYNISMKIIYFKYIFQYLALLGVWLDKYVSCHKFYSYFKKVIVIQLSQPYVTKVFLFYYQLLLLTYVALSVN